MRHKITVRRVILLGGLSVSIAAVWFLMVCVSFTTSAFAQTPTVDCVLPTPTTPDVLPKIVRGLGYNVVYPENNPPLVREPCVWKKETFGTLAQRSIKVKGRRPLPRERKIYPRFAILEEEYADEAAAQNRVDKLRTEKPPMMSIEEKEYFFGLRQAFRVGKMVYVVGTDSAAIEFSGEPGRFGLRLQAALTKDSR